MKLFFERFAVRAATIDEILSDIYIPLPGQKGDTRKAAQRLAAWCRSSASGDWEQFAKRLQRDGLSLEQVMPRLANCRLKPGAPPPGWFLDAQWVFPALCRFHSHELQKESPCTETPEPFQELYINLVKCAEARRDENLTAKMSDRMSHQARLDLTHTLLSQIADLCAHAVYESFVAFREQKSEQQGTPITQSEEFLEPDNIPSVSTPCYDEFIPHMRNTGLLNLFDSKPVLLRLVSALTRQWIDNTEEFILRLDSDICRARELLLGDNENCFVTNIQTGLSDLHNSGRSVFVVQFGDGNKIVYKPKDLRVDASWYQLVAWLNDRDSPVVLRAVRVLNCDGYGWTEFITYQNCSDRAQVKCFFARAGAWLALFHVFAATDMHEENMIASGGHPVPVDLEMILHTHALDEPSKVDALLALETANRKLSESVLMTGLLPAFSRSIETEVIGVGGLNERETEGVVEIWANINTDNMKPARIPAIREAAKNLPYLDDEPARLADFREDLIVNFDCYAKFLAENHHEIVKQGLIDIFSGLPIRKVLKPTRFYSLLLGRLKDHHNMRDGLEWSTHLDFIARLSNWDKPTEPLWPLFASERIALSQLNIPYFTCLTNGDILQDGFGIMAKGQDQTGLSVVHSRINLFDQDEIAWQSEVIRLCTLTLGLRGNGIASRAVRPPIELPETATPLDQNSIIKHSSRIADQLADLAIIEGDGAAWIGLDWFTNVEVCQLAPLGFDLYGGTSGIALFLAAHAKQTDNPIARSLALAALTPIHHFLHSSDSARFARGIGLGGALGMGSIVYALTVVSKLLQVDHLLTDAHLASLGFTDDLIEADTSYGIIDGAAGGILGLLKLYREIQDPKVLNRAIRCGEHLLQQCVQDPSGFKLWACGGTRPLTGISHGAAGFAYAFASLAAASNREDFANAAQDCLGYEKTLFSLEENNWPDLRSGNNKSEYSFPCQWCHGAGGIGLARIGMMHTTENWGVDVTPDIEAALIRVRSTWPSVDDTLCCGNLGNIEFMSEVAKTLGDEELQTLAEKRLSAILSAAELNGSFWWGIGEDRNNLGLFRGLSGLGYTLLRQVNSNQLPNVLIWE